LAEIHHRVKNNLAVVSGMMLLQAFDTENESLQAKLYDSVSRIKTMAIVHELLYQSDSFSQLEFSETLRRLVENVSETLETKAKVKLEINCDLVKLNINQAIPASLIVNEVLTNAYKHAFKDKNRGKIEFNLIEENEKIDITIKDNGVGFTEDTNQKNSLGLHLIQVLNDQIEGTYTYEKGDKGTIFTLSFNKKGSKKGIGNAGMN
ncbi:MAG: sensor histidine kinase, partial [Balneolaceae bacterium]